MKTVVGVIVVFAALLLAVNLMPAFAGGTAAAGQGVVGQINGNPGEGNRGLVTGSSEAAVRSAAPGQGAVGMINGNPGEGNRGLSALESEGAAPKVNPFGFVLPDLEEFFEE